MGIFYRYGFLGIIIIKLYLWSIEPHMAYIFGVKSHLLEICHSFLLAIHLFCSEIE